MEGASQEHPYMAARRAVLRQAVETKNIDLVSVPTALNLADISTKPLPTAQFRLLRDKILGLDSMTEPEECVQFVELRGGRLDARAGTGSGMHANAGESVSRGQDTQHQTLAVD